MKVTRYDAPMCMDGSDGDEMEEHSYGDYVTYKDYDDLMDEYNTLKKTLTTLQSKVEDLYKEI